MRDRSGRLRQSVTHAEVDDMRRELEGVRAEISRLKLLLEERMRHAFNLESKLTGLTVDGSVIRRAPHGLVRDAIIDALSERPEGLMLNEIKEQVQSRNPGIMHPRTPSMVLDRLRKEGAVSRAGRRWILHSKQGAG